MPKRTQRKSYLSYSVVNDVYFLLLFGYSDVIITRSNVQGQNNCLPCIFEKILSILPVFELVIYFSKIQDNSLGIFHG